MKCMYLQRGYLEQSARVQITLAEIKTLNSLYSVSDIIFGLSDWFVVFFFGKKSVIFFCVVFFFVSAFAQCIRYCCTTR